MVLTDCLNKNRGSLYYSSCQNLSNLILNVLSIGQSTTKARTAFQSLTIPWLNTFCVIPSLACNIYIGRLSGLAVACWTTNHYNPV